MKEEQVVTPWVIHGEKKDGEVTSVNYSKIVEQFGCTPVTQEVLDLLGGKAHRFFRRGIVFAHRDFDLILRKARKQQPIFLYTGRGPSSRSMHLGHAVPFLLCKHLQDVFDCPLVIQITDDEKYIWKDITLEESMSYGKENAKDIIAFGFDPRKTFIFSNVEYSHTFAKTTLQIEKAVTLNDFMKVFGFTKDSKVGQVAFPSRQLSPCYASAFPGLLDEGASCLIPCSIDQDPYFRMARDIAHRLASPKPATVYSVFLPALQGSGSKMSASDVNSSIYLSDAPNEIKKKINKYAFSGGRDTVEEHRQHGGNTEVDVAYQYLKFFLEDDGKLEAYGRLYREGKMLSGELKRICIEVVQEFVEDFQRKRAAITEQDLADFFNPNKPGARRQAAQPADQ